jgi:hypothetical protein
LSCPPTSHTVKLMFLYSTVSTLKPTQIRRYADTEKRRNGDREIRRYGDRVRGCNGGGRNRRVGWQLRGLQALRENLTDGRNGGHHLAQLELVKNGGLRE